MKILISTEEDLLYKDIIEFLYEIKIAQGGSALDSTLYRHKYLRNFLKEKQRKMIDDIEKTYFRSDGSIDKEAVKKIKELYKNNII